MAQKRPFDEEVVSKVLSKHPRQDGPTDAIVSHNDIVYTKDGSNEPYDSVSQIRGEASFQKSETQTREEHVHGFFPDIPREYVDIDTEVSHQSASLSHWATSSTSDEDEEHELGHVPFFPGYFNFDRPVRSVINPDDVYSCSLDYPPQKRVPVGPEYQAEIPKLDTAASEPSVMNDEQLEGFCIIPSPDNDPSAYNGERVGTGRIDCNCQDRGFIRCIRQHIAEARNKLTSTLGQDTFLELGLYDMGEAVAEKWRVEEEQLFHEVVYSNRASLGRNFWNALSAVFPSRTKMEIVSYYFNVFMLRKRAAQNRVDPFNIDSDNDEWQVSDDDDDDDDSGVESPVHHDGIMELHQNGAHELEDDDNGDLSDETRENDENDGLCYARKSDPDSTSKLPGKKSSEDDGGENDGNDGSCTSSSDSGATEQGLPEMKPQSCQEWRGYLLESTDAKTWDEYNDTSCPKSDGDFLPTCSMIKEVFGDVDFCKRR